MTDPRTLQRQSFERALREKHRLDEKGVKRALQCYDGAPLSRQTFTYTICCFESEDAEKQCRTWLRQIGALEPIPPVAQPKKKRLLIR